MNELMMMRDDDEYLLNFTHFRNDPDYTLERRMGKIFKTEDLRNIQQQYRKLF